MKRTFFVVAVGLLTTLPLRASAQSTSAHAAEGLFQEGLGLLESGKTKEACEKFVASYRLDPANGTLQNVASCHEKDGKSASAWSEWLELAGKASRAGQKEREQLARTRAAELSKELARLELKVPASSNVATIEIDGQALAPSAWTLPLPIDPGPHTIVFKAPKKRDATSTVSIAPRVNASIDVPTLEDDPNATASRETRPLPIETDQGSLSSTKRTTGFVIGGVGLAAAAVGGVFGVLAIAQKSDADCDNEVCATPEAVDSRDTAKTSALVSTIGLGVGLVAIGIGAYLVLSSGKSGKANSKASRLPFVGPDLRGIGWTGRW